MFGKKKPTTQDKIEMLLVANYNRRDWNKVIKKYIGSNPDMGHLHDLAEKFWADPTKYVEIYHLITKKYGKSTNL